MIFFLTKQKTIGTHRGWFAHDIGQGDIYMSKATFDLFGENHHIKYFGLMWEIHSFEMKVAPLHIIQESFLTQTTLKV